MDKIQLLLNSSARKIIIADKTLQETYPLVQEPKLLMGIMSNINSIVNDLIDAILINQKIKRKGFEENFRAFKRFVVGYKLNPSYMILIREVRQLMNFHKNSPIEFTRKGNLVICTKDYKIKALNDIIVSRFIDATKNLLLDVSSILNKNERILR